MVELPAGCIAAVDHIGVGLAEYRVLAAVADECSRDIRVDSGSVRLLCSQCKLSFFLCFQCGYGCRVAACKDAVPDGILPLLLQPFSPALE